ncbi:MAG: hypothetical protein ABJ084_00590 [Halioglobus sp.]
MALVDFRGTLAALIEGSSGMSLTGKWIGLSLTALMFAFSTWVYLKSGDWVAAVFAVASAAYAIFFLTRDVSGE